MKTIHFLLLLFSFGMFSNCAGTQPNTADHLYNATWELEYISGKRIAFEKLFPNNKPEITFDKDTQKVQGTNSCNAYSAPFTVREQQISFGEAGPTTLKFCGPGEKEFMNTMEKINAFSFDKKGNLNLMKDDITLLRFHKISQP